MKREGAVFPRAVAESFAKNSFHPLETNITLTVAESMILHVGARSLGTLVRMLYFPEHALCRQAEHKIRPL